MFLLLFKLLLKFMREQSEYVFLRNFSMNGGFRERCHEGFFKLLLKFVGKKLEREKFFFMFFPQIYNGSGAFLHANPN